MTTANSISGSSNNLTQPLDPNLHSGNFGGRNVEPGKLLGCPNWLKICKYIPVVSSAMMVPALILLTFKHYLVKDLTNCVKDIDRFQAAKIRAYVSWFFAIVPVLGNLAAFAWDRSAENRNK